RCGTSRSSAACSAVVATICTSVLSQMQDASVAYRWRRYSNHATHVRGNIAYTAHARHLDCLPPPDAGTLRRLFQHRTTSPLLHHYFTAAAERVKSWVFVHFQSQCNTSSI